MPLCQYCRHLNPVGVERCTKCQRWIGLGPEPATSPIAAKPEAPHVEPVEQAVEVQPLPETDFAGQVRQVLAREGKIAAVKFYREQTRVGLAEAKAAVEAIEAGSSAALPRTTSEEALLGLLRAGRKIEAIRAYRQQTGQGLKESKDYVDDLARRHGIQSPAAGCGTAALAVVLLAIAAVAAVIL